MAANDLVMLLWKATLAASIAFPLLLLLPCLLRRRVGARGTGAAVDQFQSRMVRFNGGSSPRPTTIGSTEQQERSGWA